MIEIIVTEEKFVDSMEWLHVNLGRGFESGTMNAYMHCPRWEWAWTYENDPWIIAGNQIRKTKRCLTFRNEDDAIIFKLACL
jgi:hypothetical protein